MSLDEAALNFSGLTHDHTSLEELGSGARTPGCACSTIAILRRHPMYDSLVLVKRFRNCLNGYALEFPDDTEAKPGDDSIDSNGQRQDSENQSPGRLGCCSQRKLISRFLDGDDPITPASAPVASVPISVTSDPQTVTFASQLDDRGDQCELVHVPINGLLDRLKAYTNSGVAVDSRVYAFAMGLKTAERILTTSAVRELQETPI